MKIYLSFFGAILMLMFMGCQQGKSDQTSKTSETQLKLFSQLSPEQTGVTFQNNLYENIFDGNNIMSHEYYYNGGGVLAEDFNNDGFIDLFFTGQTESNRLFINKGDLTFKDVTEKAGLLSDKFAQGATAADVNNDGFLDIYVCNAGPKRDELGRANELFINMGDGTFQERGRFLGAADFNYSLHASFFDYDKDGDLDIVVTNHGLDQKREIRYTMEDCKNPEFVKKYTTNLYQNNGKGHFTKATEAAGLLRFSYGLGLVVSDLNNDDWPDIYVSNDYWVPDFMFLNNGDGTFTDHSGTSTKRLAWFSMGVDAADYNNDGFIDIATVDMAPPDHFRSKVYMKSMQPEIAVKLEKYYDYPNQSMYNAFQLNNGNNTFSNVSHQLKLSKTDWSWTSLFADLNNDGRRDYIVTNGIRKQINDNDFDNAMTKVGNQYGYVPDNLKEEIFNMLKPIPLTNNIYHNVNDYTLEDKAIEWAIAYSGYTSGCAVADLDNDGDKEIIFNNTDDFPSIYRNNNIEQNNFIRFNFSDHNQDAEILNAKVYLYLKDELIYEEITRSRGFFSALPVDLTFGIGKHTLVDSIKIKWPDGLVEKIETVNAGDLVTIKKGSHIKSSINLERKSTLFNSIEPASIGMDFLHQENEYYDYDMEILLPHEQSKLGPALCKGDWNNDGLEDVFIGGAHGFRSALYFQTSEGRFQKQSFFTKDKDFEDNAALAVDVNNDGWQDLYVGSGSGEFYYDRSMLTDRIYINDGSGNLIRNKAALPNLNTNTSTILSADIDNDGDLDLFVGSRALPAKYPYPDESYILRNDKGTFTIVQTLNLETFPDLGLITDGSFADINKDGWMDLLLVGEWMYPHLLLNKGEVNNTPTFSLESNSYGLDQYSGWWYSVAAADLNIDGHLDFVCGNLGQNNKFKVKKDYPFTVYSGDFDANGVNDIVLTQEYKGLYVPVRGFQCSSEQMPSLQNQFDYFRDFARSTTEDIYGVEQLDAGIKRHVDLFESVIFYGSDSTYTIQELPKESQMSPINDIIITDVNDDAQLDIITVGNNYNTEVETPRYDAGRGNVLLQQNKTFSYLPIPESGFYVPENSKKMVAITVQGNDYYVIGNNNQRLRIIQKVR